LALRLALTDAEGNESEEWLSSGDLKNFAPSADGTEAIPQGSQTKLNSNTNAVAFILSVINADTRGELAAKIRSTTNISVLEGTKMHVVRKPQPKRTGIVQQPQGDGGNRAPSQLTCEKINAYSWEAGGAVAGKTATASAPAAGAPAASASPAAAAAAGMLMGLVLANNNSIAKNAVAGKIFNTDDFKALPPAERNAILGVIVQDGFLRSDAVTGMGLTYDGTTIKLG